MTSEHLAALITQNSGNPLEILKTLGGYYKCPKGPQNERLGPLVAYAGTYPVDPEDPNSPKLQYVGEEYANFAKAETYPAVLSHFTSNLVQKIDFLKLTDKVVFVGPQMGGIGAAMFMAYHAEIYGYEACYACAEKKVTVASNEAGSKEETILQFSRHEVPVGYKAIICEDVTNNLSTTGKTIKLIEENGGEVVGITTLLNRSPEQVTHYEYKGRQIPIISLVSIKIEQWTQDDPAVSIDIECGNVVFDTKANWSKLSDAMKKNNAFA